MIDTIGLSDRHRPEWVIVFTGIRMLRNFLTKSPSESHFFVCGNGPQLLTGVSETAIMKGVFFGLMSMVHRKGGVV